MRDYTACRYAPPSALVIDRVSAMLWRAIQAISPDEIWMPLGLGNHFDHRMIRDACLDLICGHWSDLQSVRIMFYEDLPCAWNYPGTVDAVVKMLRRRGAEMKRQSLDIDSVLAEKIERLQIYASQFEIDKIRPVIEGYARLASSAKGGYAETLWQRTRPPSFPFAPLVVVRGVPHALVEEAARRIFERRRCVHRLGLLIGHQISNWVEVIQILVKLYPNSLVDGLASIGNRDQLCAIDNPRFRLSFFDESKWTLVFLLMRWAFRCHNMVLIFGGARAREAGWMAKVLPSRYADAFENWRTCAVCGGTGLKKSETANE